MLYYVYYVYEKEKKIFCMQKYICFIPLYNYVYLLAIKVTFLNSFYINS